MVFSQTSHKTQSILKVVDLDRLKPEKNQQVNGSTGVVTDEITLMEATTSPMANTSFSEVRAASRHDYLKPEPLFEEKMFHDSDSEFFQDLVPWCSTPAKEEHVQIIDSKRPEERAHTIDTLHTPISPQGWDGFDPNSPYPQTGFYNTTPVDPLSPNVEAFAHFDPSYLELPELDKENKITFQEQFLDISSLPVVIGDLVSERVSNAHPWPVAAQDGWAGTQDTDNRLNTNSHNTLPFIDQEDSLDLKFVSVIPREVENNDIVLSEYIVQNKMNTKGVHQELEALRPSGGLSVDVATRAPNWSNDIVSTPEILSYVEQLEKEKCPQITSTKELWPVHEVQETLEFEDPSTKIDLTSVAEYEPITPKSESQAESDHDDLRSHASKRRRRDTDDSDETYTPYSDQTPRKYKRRKPNIPIKDMIMALEGTQQLTKARRGRPPKRRESAVSSVCSVDENSSCASTTEIKYRELRDKNNEASKRSRMNRKLKELQMEQLADELEEKNKKLMVRADILEDMTKRLKEALMTAILQK